MATLSIEKKGTKVKVTEGSANPAYLPSQNYAYFFDSEDTFVLADKNSTSSEHKKFTCQLSELRIAGSATAPVSKAAAYTALESVFS